MHGEDGRKTSHAEEVMKTQGSNSWFIANQKKRPTIGFASHILRLTHRYLQSNIKNINTELVLYTGFTGTSQRHSISIIHEPNYCFTEIAPLHRPPNTHTYLFSFLAPRNIVLLPISIPPRKPRCVIFLNASFGVSGGVGFGRTSM